MSTAESARTAALPTTAAPERTSAPGAPTNGQAAPTAKTPAKAAPAKAASAKTTATTALAKTAAPTPVTATATGGAAAGAPKYSPRRIRLTVSHIDPWSTMKMAFLLSVALGIAMVVMTAVLWTILSGMGVFTKVNSLIGSVIQEGGRPFDIMDFVGFGRVISLSIVIAVFDVILMTALSMLGAFLYNVSASLVGGAQVTLTDE